MKFADPDYKTIIKQGFGREKHRVRRIDLDQIRIKNANKWDSAQKTIETSMMKAEMSGSDSDDSFDKLENERITQSMDIITIYEDVKVYDYAHKGFHKLRYIDGISNEIIQDSLNPDFNFESAKKAGESTGKSGSFFFFSHNKQFIIKTMF